MLGAWTESRLSGASERMVSRMLWTRSQRFDKDCLPLADRHYNRQKPGSPQFVPPGRCVVLKAPGGRPRPAPRRRNAHAAMVRMRFAGEAMLPSVSDIFCRHDLPLAVLFLSCGFFGAWVGSHDRYVYRWLGCGLIIIATLGIGAVARGWL
jgi:hypothetical protein